MPAAVACSAQVKQGEIYQGVGRPPKIPANKGGFRTSCRTRLWRRPSLVRDAGRRTVVSRACTCCKAQWKIGTRETDTEVSIRVRLGFASSVVEPRAFLPQATRSVRTEWALRTAAVSSGPEASLYLGLVKGLGRTKDDRRCPKKSERRSAHSTSVGDQFPGKLKTTPKQRTAGGRLPPLVCLFLPGLVQDGGHA
jgi:hypothetical protein